MFILRRHKMVSDKQLQANQENAVLGGVKTPEGKSVSKYNAQVHGILRQSITEYEQEFYSEILNDLKNEYKPQGVIEEILIERIAINYLKLFRLQKAETEFIKSQLNPKVIKEFLDLDNLGEVLNEGYTPKIGSESVEKLAEIYARYETTIENRLFRAIQELERAQKLRMGEDVLPTLTVDVNEMGSFGETDKNL